MSNDDSSAADRGSELSAGLGPDLERDEFQAWACVRDYDVTHSNATPQKYANERTQGAWQAWGHASSNWRAQRDIAVSLLRDIVAAYDAYRGCGFKPASGEYAEVVARIEAARRGLGA